MGNLGLTSDRASYRKCLRGAPAMTVAIAMALGLVAGIVPSTFAASPLVPIVGRSGALEASTSDAARRDAVRSIPFEKLSAADRAKVQAVLSNVTVFRRLPTRVVDCDPEFYVFLVRHPDVVVNIWEMFKISRLKLRETDDREFSLNESAGALATIRFVYQNHDTHVIYGEGVYKGPLLARAVKGRGLLILKSGYVRETNGRYYVTSRMDSFLSIEPSAAEVVTKTISPVLGKTVDNNFTQTLAFVGSLSRTAEVNSRGVQRLGGQLMHVPPEVRERFVQLAAEMPQKQPAAAEKASSKVASQRESRDAIQR
jgi:hypothetical protein